MKTLFSFSFILCLALAMTSQASTPVPEDELKVTVAYKTTESSVVGVTESSYKNTVPTTPKTELWGKVNFYVIKSERILEKVVNFFVDLIHGNSSYVSTDEEIVEAVEEAGDEIYGSKRLPFTAFQIDEACKILKKPHVRVSSVLLKSSRGQRILRVVCHYVRMAYYPAKRPTPIV
ncbi:hypothetical protein QAD02_010581 [Eretmocerus hayati]|uniref:Uncharacterized protein n=1 Tax=Eretmocerus hayati TaxID=131215 RepID=A0ACC2NUE0_9HYME|nr:hypothetical protein QAD02_010581 [Eretmocerus hayati]